MNALLSVVEARVLGALIEKELATPAYYPMTVNSLVAACNQKSNRDPVMQLEADEVQAALEELRYRERLVGSVSQAGSRMAKFRHHAAETLMLAPLELAVMCELLVRGAQTVGELRLHVQRLGVDLTPETASGTLDDLAGRTTGALVAEIPPGAGRREPRWMHLLCGAGAPELTGESVLVEPALPVRSPMQERLEKLESGMRELVARMDDIQQSFERFRKQFE
jgi:uncharacterized protein